MKVLLINPSRIYYKFSKDIRLGLPLGIMYIASVLERESISVSIFDCLISNGTRIQAIPGGKHHGVADGFLKDVVANETPDIVGITCPFTAQLDSCLHTAKLVKEVNSDIFVVAGGPHFSVTGKDFLIHNQNVDCFVSGEGEIPMLELAKAFKEKRYYENIKGITYRTGGFNSKTIIRSNPPESIKDLDSLPLPAYHLIDMDLFFDLQSQGLVARYGTRKGAISIITSRGCPFNCVFCSVHLHMGKRVRTHSADYVISHLQCLVDKYRIGHIFFEDDAFTFKPKRAQEIFELMVKKGIHITWHTPNGVRADTLNEELLKIMKKAGCTALIVGTESGDQDTLDKIIKKRQKLEDIVQVAKRCKKLKIELSSFFVIGFPGETKEKIQKSLDFAIMLYKKYNVLPLLMHASPLIGTELYNTVVNGGYSVRDINQQSLSAASSSYNAEGLIRTPDFTPEDLYNISEQFRVRLRKIQSKKNIVNPRRYFNFFKAVVFRPIKIVRAAKQLVTFKS